MFEYLKKNKKYLIFYPLAVYWLVLFTATTLPSSKLPDVGMNDKYEHFIAYSGLGLLLYLALAVQQKYPLLNKFPYVFTLVIGVTYGALDEIHQYVIPGRSMDVHDWFADSSGICIGLLLAFLIRLADRLRPAGEN